MQATEINNKNEPSSVLVIDSLDVQYATENGAVKAVRDVSLKIEEGETVGVAGESGSGKSTLALAIMRYLGQNGGITEGDIYFNGQSLLDLSQSELRKFRGNRISHVAQDPKTSLNPSITVGEQIAETVRIHRNVSKQESMERTYEVLHRVNFPDPQFNSEKHPHELSGGMQQRVLLAIALVSEPELLILDEPTTGLDVTTQAKILDLIENLKETLDTSVLLITHDLGVIAEIADRVSIMYAGEIMEHGPIDAVFRDPTNPYTQGLLAALPGERSKKELRPIEGKIPSLTDIPDGCIFADRCEFAEEACRSDQITDEVVSEKGNHQTKCRRWEYARENSILEEDDEMESATSIERRAGDTLIRTENLKKHFSESSFLDRIFGKEPPVKPRVFFSS